MAYVLGRDTEDVDEVFITFTAMQFPDTIRKCLYLQQ